jgi:hypothetical protein
VTSGHVSPVIPAPVVGLSPTFPVIADAGTSVTDVPANTAKLPAVPSPTVVGVAAALLPASTKIAPSIASTDKLAPATATRERLVRFEMKRVMWVSLSDCNTDQTSRQSACSDLLC